MSKCKSNFTRIIRYLFHFDFPHGTFSHFPLPLFNLFFSILCIRTLAPVLLIDQRSHSSFPRPCFRAPWLSRTQSPLSRTPRYLELFFVSLGPNMAQSTLFISNYNYEADRQTSESRGGSRNFCMLVQHDLTFL